MIEQVMQPSVLERLLIAYARGFPVRRGKLRITNALWRAAAGGRDARRLARLKCGGFVMPCDLEEMLQRQFYFFGTYFLEDELLDCWASAAASARVVLDVGANTGIYSLTALAAQPTAAVHAFEPTPEIAAGLRATAELNRLPGLSVHEAAVSDRTGHVVLQRFRGETGDNGGMNFVVAEEGARSSERVASVRLDEFCRERGIERIDLMKLDVQGHEPAVLSGAGRLIDEGRIATLFMELNWSEDGAEPCPATDALRRLEAAGYLFSEPSARPKFRKSGDWMRALSDIVGRHYSVPWEGAS